MNKKIQDALTDKPMSRQRKYQMRKKQVGRCTICGKDSGGMSRCEKCRDREVDRFRI